MILDILLEASKSSLQTILKIAMIVIPLMIVMRFTKEANILDKICSYFRPFTKRLYLSNEATFPLIVGLVFGLSYGAGIIIQAAKEGNLTGRDLILLNVFLALFHSVFEDTLIFASIGANIWIIIVFRLLMAILFTYFIGRWLVKNKPELAFNKSL